MVARVLRVRVRVLGAALVVAASAGMLGVAPADSALGRSGPDPAPARAAPSPGTRIVSAGSGAVRAVGAPAARTDRVRSSEYWLDDDGIRSAWAVTRGAGVTVAVIDTGVDGSVPDLVGAVSGGTDVSGIGSPDGQEPIGEEPGHGTWVASLLAGRGHGGGDGVLGVAPEAHVLAVSASFGTTESDVSDDDQVADAVRWSVDHGASVINLSLTRNTLGWPTSWDRAFRYAFDHDVVVVAAAGNRGSGTEEVGAPATIPGVLAVAGVDRSGVASRSASAQGITLGVAAPSEQLVGADPSGGYVLWSGTSGAAPIVSGVVALVRAAHPGLTADDVLERVLATARGGGDPALYGHGIVDADAAVTSDVPTVSSNPLGSLAEWIRVHRRASEPERTRAREAAPVVTPVPAAPDAADLLVPGYAWVTGSAVPAALAAAVLWLGLVAVLAVRARRRREERRVVASGARPVRSMSVPRAAVPARAAPTATIEGPDGPVTCDNEKDDST